MQRVKRRKWSNLGKLALHPSLLSLYCLLWRLIWQWSDCSKQGQTVNHTELNSKTLYLLGHRLSASPQMLLKCTGLAQPHIDYLCTEKRSGDTVSCISIAATLSHPQNFDKPDLQQQQQHIQTLAKFFKLYADAALTATTWRWHRFRSISPFNANCSKKCCRSKGPAPYCLTHYFLFLTFGRSGAQSRVLECQKLNIVG